MSTLRAVSASARPLVISGIALAMPPVPVLVPTPAPVRLNHSSRVKLVAPTDGSAAAPKVTYWLVPLSCRPVPALADGVALTVGRGAEASWPPASTATTT